MISKRTSSVPKEDVALPRLLDCDSRCSETDRRRSQVCPWRSQVLPGLLSAVPGLSAAFAVTLKARRNALLGSDTLLKLMHLNLHSTSSQTLLEASSAYNTFCWCSLKLHAFVGLAANHCCLESVIIAAGVSPDSLIDASLGVVGSAPRMDWACWFRRSWRSSRLPTCLGSHQSLLAYSATTWTQATWTALTQ